MVASLPPWTGDQHRPILRSVNWCGFGILLAVRDQLREAMLVTRAATREMTDLSTCTHLPTPTCFILTLCLIGSSKISLGREVSSEHTWAALSNVSLHFLIRREGGPCRQPVCIRTDNQGAQSSSKNAEYHARTKHIDVRYHFLHQEVAAGKLGDLHVSTTEQTADDFTKPLRQARTIY